LIKIGRCRTTTLERITGTVVWKRQTHQIVATDAAGGLKSPTVFVRLLDLSGLNRMNRR